MAPTVTLGIIDGLPSFMRLRPWELRWSSISFMNRWARFDSKDELDYVCRQWSVQYMDYDDQDKDMWVLERRDPSRNMARYYLLVMEPSLFGDTALLRRWGRLGKRGPERRSLYESEQLAREALDEWLRRKTMKGYRPVAVPSSKSS